MRRAREGLFLMTLMLGCTELTGRVPRDASLAPVAPLDQLAPLDPPKRCPVRVDEPPAPALLAAVEPGRPLSVFGVAYPRALDTDASGRTYVAGQCDDCVLMGHSRAAVWRFSGDDHLDAEFGDQGRALAGSDADHATLWTSIQVDANDRALVAGARVAPPSRQAVVARFTFDGGTDATFGRDGQFVLPATSLPNPSGTFAYAALAAQGGVIAVGSVSPTSPRPGPTRALLFRLDARGVLDPSFGAAGVLVVDTLRGCFDAAVDGPHVVVACTSDDERPALLRLDAHGATTAWGDAAEAAAHPTAPRGFHARALRRDSQGRWLVVGVVSRLLNDLNATPAAVRYRPDGRADRSYGDDGVALLRGARQTFNYTYRSTAQVGCEDRLLIAAQFGATGVVAVLDAAGHLLDTVGERGYVQLPVRAQTYTATVAGLAARGNDTVVLTDYLPPAFTLHRISP